MQGFVTSCIKPNFLKQTYTLSINGTNTQSVLLHISSWLGQRSFDIFELNEKRQQNLILSDVFDVERAVYQEYIKNDTCSCLNCKDYNCVKCVTCECNKKCLVIKNPNETIKLKYILSRELHCVQTRSMN